MRADLCPQSRHFPSLPTIPKFLLPYSLFLARHIEKAGTGTLDMIALLREAGLPGPEFRQQGGMFVQAIWRDWLTAEVLARYNLNERQLQAVAHVKRLQHSYELTHPCSPELTHR